MPQQNSQPSLYDDYPLKKNDLLSHLFIKLEARVHVELDKLKEQKAAKKESFFSITTDLTCKILFIEKQMHLLKRAVFIKQNDSEYVHLIDNKTQNDDNLEEIINSEFNTINDLMQFHTSSWNESSKCFNQNYNIKSALNSSRIMMSLSAMSFTPEVLWDKSTTLDNFEKELEKQPDFDVIKYQEQRVNSFNNPVLRWEEFQSKLSDRKSPSNCNYAFNPTNIGPM